MPVSSVAPLASCEKFPLSGKVNGLRFSVSPPGRYMRYIVSVFAIGIEVAFLVFSVFTSVVNANDTPFLRARADFG